MNSLNSVQVCGYYIGTNDGDGRLKREYQYRDNEFECINNVLYQKSTRPDEVFSLERKN
jgi:hypothetical protein